MSKKSLSLLSIIGSILPIILSFVSFLTIKNSKSYKLDSFCYDLVNYNQESYYSNFKSPILNVNHKEQSPDHFSNVLAELHYAFYTNGVREPLSNKVRWLDTELTLLTQPTFTILKDTLPDGTHYLDYGVFSTYYSNEILSNYMETRFGAKTFVYISDTLANKLLTYYKIPDYKTLIINKDYCLLNLVIDDEITYTVCINNVISTNSRNGPRSKYLYENFALIYLNKFNESSKWANVEFEVDLKIDPFGTKRVFNTLEQSEYTIQNSNFMFKTEIDGQYQENIQLNNKFVKCYQNNDFETLWIILFVLICIITAFIYLFIIYVLKINKIIVIISCHAAISEFFLFGIYSCFSYINPLTSVVPIICFIGSLIFVFSKSLSKFKNFFRDISRGDYYELNL